VFSVASDPRSQSDLPSAVAVSISGRRVTARRTSEQSVIVRIEMESRQELKSVVGEGLLYPEAYKPQLSLIVII
jgi:hypothetical protein